MASRLTETPTPPPNKRRPHKKSRNGCSECRRRRIKCSEDRPRCRCCARNDTECLYPAPKTSTCYPTPESDNNLNTATQSSPTQLLVEPVVFPPPWPSPCGTVDENRDPTIFTMDDMALLHHWTTSTSRTIVGLSGADYWWQEAFPRVAFGHPFLMHGILSLAALHLAHMHVGDDRKRYMADAARRQNLALPGFGQAIANMSDANSDSIFACASVNIAYVFGMYGDLYDSGNVGSSHSARNARVLGAEWIPMIRGIDAVLKPIYEHTRLGPLSPLLNLENWGELDPDSEEPDDTDRQMCKLRTIWDDGPDGELYDQTLYIMRKCYLYMRQFTRTVETAVEPAFYNRTWSGPMMWLVFLPEDFLIRLRQRQPAALVLFAYLGVMLHSVDNLWIFRGWGTNIVDVVDGILGDYFRPWMEWPKEAVGFTSREN